MRRAPLAGVIVALALAAAANPANAAVGIVRLEATLTPSPALFGQPVTAELDVLVNTKKADPASVDSRARFLPYVLVARPCARTSATATSFVSDTPIVSPATRRLHDRPEARA